MKLFLESSLKEAFQIHFLKTNFRKTNIYKGRLDFYMILAFFYFIARLITMIARYKPVLAYYPVTATQLGWIGRDIWCLFLCRLFGVKTVIHLRGSHLKLNFQLFHPIAKRLVRIACRSISLALVQASCLTDQFEGLISKNKIKTIYNAIDADVYNFTNLKDYDHNMVLFMGHMTQAKGFCDIVRAIPLVAKEFPEVKFYFAGTMRKGERNVFFDQTTGAPLKYEDPFILHDYILSGENKDNYVNLDVVTGDEKMSLLRRTNIFVLPSYSEGFSRSLLEAMSMGKPVVCSAVGAHGEVVRDGINGFVVCPGAVNNLANRIICLLKDISCREMMGETNYHYVREKFDISIIAKKMEEYLKDVITGT